MPQYPLVPPAGGNSTTLNITAAKVIKAVPGRLWSISVVVAGTAAGAVYDAATTGAAAVANQIGVIPDAAGVVAFGGMPVSNGIVVTPGAGQTLAVSWA